MNAVGATALSPIFAAAASAPKRALIVSIHDVAPATRIVSEKIISELESKRVNACSILVVPDYHHGGNSTDDDSFVRWLRELEERGHEIVIHGYFHERPRGAVESWREQIITRVYTNDEGEFYDLSYEESFRRITRARDDFSAAGLRPRGFIAPAWLLGRAGERAAADAEMEYTTRLATIRDLRSGKDFHSRSLVYSVRNQWRRVSSMGWNAALYARVKRSSLVRFGIHPPDRSHPEIWRQILRLIEELAESRTPTTYQEWVADQRANASDR